MYYRGGVSGARRGTGGRGTDAGGALLGEVAVLGELLVELAFRGELEHEEDALLVVEVAVQPEHVRVPQVLLNLDLAPDLLLHLVLDDLRLVQALEREDVLGLDLRPHHVHPPKLALPQRTPNVKVGQPPFPRWPRSVHPTIKQLPFRKG